MGLKINGSTSGSIEIDVPAVAGTDTSITIPATSGGQFIVSDSAGDVNIDSGTLFVDSSANSVGMGTTSPSNYDAAARNLVVSGSGDAGITVVSGTSNGGNIYFADGTTGNEQYRGWITYSHNTDALRLATAGTERMRADSNGAIRLGSTALTSAGGGNFSTLVVSESSSGNHVINAFNTHISFSDQVIVAGSYNTATSGYSLLSLYSGNGSSSAYNDKEFNLRGDGNGYCDGSWNGGGADYAEYFEWSDGNTASEDRRGISVVLDGDKIREAVAGEDPIGVISGNPSVIGDADMDRWKNKYLRDDFGAYVLQEHEKTDDDGNTFRQTHRVLNPDWDEEMEYSSREDRPEWDTVGLMGKLRIRKGQVTGARWIKMRDISDNVEEWLVR